ELGGYGITNYNNLIPEDIINWQSLFTLKGFILMVAGGFLVGFGTRYAGGCTSGHAIMGLSNLQLSSLIATICFMVGGFIMANLILPFILSLLLRQKMQQNTDTEKDLQLRELDAMCVNESRL